MSLPKRTKSLFGCYYLKQFNTFMVQNKIYKYNRCTFIFLKTNDKNENNFIFINSTLNVCPK